MSFLRPASVQRGCFAAKNLRECSKIFQLDKKIDKSETCIASKAIPFSVKSVTDLLTSEFFLVVVR